MDDQQTGTLSKNIYLTRYAWGEQQISTPPHPLLNLIVTIPCYNEPDLISSLKSLYQCETAGVYAEVIVVINEPTAAPENISQQNKTTYKEALRWAADHTSESLKFFIIYKDDLPPKHAGVGLARKIAMDEAVRRYETLSKPEGVILCFDADSTCDKTYLQAVHDFFEQHSKAPGCSIYFEHPLAGNYQPEIYEAIVEYELFLRYYVNALRYAGFPYAYETIGSSMAVRSAAYQKQGGMNRRKAGEDFYFLHKIIPLGDFGEVNNTRVIPSPRRSDRVPFGTGKAVNDWLVNKELLTYALNTFEDLKYFLNGIHALFKIAPLDIPTFVEQQPASVKKFLQLHEFDAHINRINQNSASQPSFLKQFFQWFDGFKVLKFVHYARDNYYPNIPVGEAAAMLFNKLGIDAIDNCKALLGAYRKKDRGFS